MTSPELQAVLYRLVSSLLLMIAFGMLASWFWACSRIARGLPLLTIEPFATPGRATWGPGTLLALIALYAVAQSAAWGLYRTVVGVDLSVVSSRYQEEVKEQESASIDANPDEDEAGRIARDALHIMSWNATFSMLFLAAFPWVFKGVSGARLGDLGFTTTRVSEQVQVGVVAGLIATPAVYIIHSLALRFFPPRLHPVQQMLEVDFDPVMAGVSVLSAVVLAPLFEETLFRGVLQGWLSRVFQEMADSFRSQKSSEPEDEVTTTPTASAPSRVGIGAGWAGLLLTSAIFAIIHYAQWPTPIPLFALALVMGWLRLRTGSLLAPIVVHALFNGASTLAMLAVQLNPSPVIDAVPPPPIELTTWIESFAVISR